MADVIITGPPRSGTSYLCAVLNGLSNWVVLNEPPEAYQRPVMVRRAFRELREDIIAGRSVRNKMRDGRFIEDTIEHNAYEEYVPKIEDDGFCLAIKCPMVFMMMLPRMIEVMPNKRKIACVRNPIDTIASWKNSFEHLDAPTTEQAQMWTKQAQRLYDHRAHLHLLVYELWIQNPADYLGQIPGLFSDDQLAALPQSKPRTSKRDGLAAEDVELIRSRCGEVAEKLGVSCQ